MLSLTVPLLPQNILSAIIMQLQFRNKSLPLRLTSDVLVDVSGMCQNAAKKQIMFPVSEITSCHMELNIAKFDDCLQLR